MMRRPELVTTKRGRDVFDFPRWRTCLETKAEALKTEGMQIHFAAGPDDSRKPAMVLEIILNGMYGSFENWATGETDYTVMPLQSRTREPVAYKWGLIVTDDTFEATFAEFLDQFRRHAGRQDSN